MYNIRIKVMQACILLISEFIQIGINSKIEGKKFEYRDWY